MGRFYQLSEVITPVMAWGFLGTDLIMQQHCDQLKVRKPLSLYVPTTLSLSLQTTITEFLQRVFSLKSVSYSSVQSLAEDILSLAQHTGSAL